MKKTLSAIVLFVGFFFCCSSAAGQHSRTAADKHNLDDHLLTATMDCDSNLIKSLLEKGANIETRESHEGDTPLIMAATSCPTDTVKLLLGKGANKEAEECPRRNGADDGCPIEAVSRRDLAIGERRQHRSKGSRR